MACGVVHPRHEFTCKGHLLLRLLLLLLARRLILTRGRTLADQVRVRRSAGGHRSSEHVRSHRRKGLRNWESSGARLIQEMTGWRNGQGRAAVAAIYGGKGKDADLEDVGDDGKPIDVVMGLRRHTRLPDRKGNQLDGPMEVSQQPEQRRVQLELALALSLRAATPSVLPSLPFASACLPYSPG